MTTVTQIRVPPPTDRRILDLFTKAAQSESATSFEVRIPGARLGSFSDTKSFSEQHSGNWNTSKLLDHVSLNFRGEGESWVTLHFRRLITNGDGRTERSMWENELAVEQSTHPRGPTSSLLLEALHWADEFRKAIVGKPAEDDGPTNLTRDIFAAQISQLTDLHARIVEEAETARITQESLFASRRAELEAEHATRLIQVDDLKEAARAKIEAEEERLEAVKKELDDRGHMHARRQLRADITSALKTRLERPGVSRQTALLRFAVVTGSALGIIGFGTVAALGIADLHQVYSMETPNLYVLGFASARFAVPAAAAAGLLFYVLGWLRRLHAEDVQSERDLERYRYDLDRASWTIETILEAQGKEGGTVPPEWTAGVTHGLFTRSSGGSEERDAADALGSLLNFAAKAEFGPGGPKLEFHKRDLRRLSREASEEG
ncbi:MAG TPA: hypothetical protein VN018_02515 [Brevundimonas sp.]|nr:hypothetical protein [Brevundimonas sp.]